MAVYLYKLGRFAFRRRFLVPLFWVAVLAVSGAAAASAASPKDSGFAIPGSEVQRAFDLLDERFPGSSSDGATARVVFEAPDGGKMTDAANKAEVRKLVEELKSSSTEVATVNDPYTTQAVSRDGRTAYISVSYKVSGDELGDPAKDALFKAVDEARATGLVAEVGGDAAAAGPASSATEIVGVVIAAFVLFITFGSLVAAGLPLLSAILSVGIGLAGFFALANTVGLGTQSSTLGMMLGLAVGIDYALFIVSRYRSELAEGHEREEAAGRAVGTAGSAVVFAGLTVIIALVGLAVVNVPVLTKMGIAAAATVALTVLVALTFTPAMLGIAGDKVLPRKVRKARKNGEAPAKASNAGGAEKPGIGTRWVRFVLRRPVAVLLAGVVGLGVVAIPMTSLELGLGDDGTQPTSTTQRRAYDLLADGFGPGFNGPLITVVDAKKSDDPKAAAGEVVAAVRALDDVASVAPATFNKAGDTAVITVIPKSGPSSEETTELVKAIRQSGASITSQTGASVLVTGLTAVNIDFSQRMSDSLIPYLIVVVGLAFLLLIVVFRSILVPLKAALGFLLSVLAALGAVVAVFQWGWLSGVFGVEETAPIMSLVPIFMIGVVFGLAMDYEVFLVTRMREAYVHGASPGDAIVTGFRHSAKVVTAAAVIMISVFAGFLASSDGMTKLFGFSFAIAVLFDAFVVRMAIVPAVLALLGERAWWLPKWVDKALPNVDVEGERLNKAVPAAAGQGAPEEEPVTV
ncbi:MMPL family transporter [Streptomyces sp. NPDC096311]|uniref:MMPL family transporter n=1 Tax=Streptomyces sp. NPDC096311 TaxID=3366083 RepID=UPI00381D0D55